MRDSLGFGFGLWVALQVLPGCSSGGGREREASTGPTRNAWFVPDPSPTSSDSSDSAIPDEAAIAIDMGAQVSSLAPLSSRDLAPLFAPDAKLVGVVLSVDEQVYVLEARTGLYVLKDTGPELVFDLRASHVVGGTGDGSPPTELTDVAFDGSYHAGSLTSNFLLTAENDGFWFSLDEPSVLNSFFCYFPPIPSWSTDATPSVSQELREQGIAVSERTEAVAQNNLSWQIIAQPRTIRIDGAGVAGSELFVFDGQGGQPVGTKRFQQTEFSAGGAAFLEPSLLVLGYLGDLYAAANWDLHVIRAVTLEGVQEISGLATGSNPVSAFSTLFVLDGPGKRLLAFDGSAVLTIIHEEGASPLL